MKRLLILLCVTLIFSCEEEPEVDYTVVSGKIESPKAENISISGNDFEATITLDTDGTFKDTLNLAEAGFYTLNHGREITTIYLANGQDLMINLDTNQFDESLKYSGKGSIENNYLASKMMSKDEFRMRTSEIYALEEEDFLKYIDSLDADNRTSLKSLKGIDESFVTMENTNLKFDKFSMLNSYGQYHPHYAKKTDYKVSKGFLPEEMKTMSFDDTAAYKTSESYRDLAFNDVMDDIFDSIGDDYQNASTEDLQPINDIKIEELRDRVIGYLGNFLVSPANPNMQELYSFFTENTDDEKIKKDLTAKYDKIKDLTKGNPSPKFVKYENHKGGTMSLTDLKGKYVYVDVWATWCGPCIREIPALKEVEEEYKGRNIHFVSTSIDVADKHDVWVNMVKDKELGGIQLMADNAWQSNFVQDYAIDGIPRFILIDPEGNIVSADAPRPSNPKLIEMLEGLNI